MGKLSVGKPCAGKRVVSATYPLLNRRATLGDVGRPRTTKGGVGCCNGAIVLVRTYPGLTPVALGNEEVLRQRDALIVEYVS